METQNPYNRGVQPTKPELKSSFNGRALAGLVVVIVGSSLLVKQLGVPMPHWIISWPMLLIVLGLYTGFKHNFKNMSWLILVSIGGVFLVSDILDDFSLHRYFWPVFIIGIGLYMILKPKKKEFEFWGGEVNSSENLLDATAIFGGVKKNIITKDFKGGEVTSIFGGSEINLSQADITGKIFMDVTAIFGGSEIIVPSNWQVSTEGVTAILGGVDDKRAIMANANPDPTKVLVIRGVAMFGGIEIKSF